MDPATLAIPAFQDVMLAKKIIGRYLARTPFYTYPAVNDLLGVETYIKHENYQPVGAFKVRGGINLVSRLSDEEKKRGVIAASTGNHGQSIAFASRLFGVKARIVVPNGANPGKVAAMQGMGTEVIFYGDNFEFAKNHCEELSAKYGYRYIDSGNEPLLIAGVATEALEMIEEQPNLDVIIVPIGGGSGAAGACIAAKAVNPKIRVLGVQSRAAPAAYECWRQGVMTTAECRTFAEGLATGAGFELPQRILRRHLDDFILVGDESIKQAMVWMIERAHTLAEAAGASSLAAAWQLREELKGKKVGLVCSGGNTSLEHLKLAFGMN
jgi:threonine dehydratase